MSISMYDISAPVYSRSLDNLASMLVKAKAFCEAQGVEESTLLDYRLFCNMLPFSTQVQVVTDQARNGLAYLTGTDPMVIEQEETTFDALLARVERSKTFVSQFTEEQLSGTKDSPVSFMIANYRLDFPTGLQFLQGYSLPNLYFHTTTAYNILRHNGVDVGKGDFLGDFGGQVSVIEEAI